MLKHAIRITNGTATSVTHAQYSRNKHSDQWRRQRSKGARPFRGQKILQTGHPDALFSSKKLTTLFDYRFRDTGRQRRFTVKIKNT